MPQLDIITFVDQTLYVYIFFVLNYLLISIFVLPKIYQVLAIKNLLISGLIANKKILFSNLNNSSLLLSLFESKFDFSVNQSTVVVK
jgi:hypothetical protein